MSFITSMQQRYTTKKYDPTKKIDNEKIEELKQILQLSPSSINSQPWKFTFVSDQKTKEKLSKVSWVNNEKVINCDTLIVLSRVDNIEAFENRIKEELPEGAVTYFNQFIKTKPEHAVKGWFDRQVYLALGVLLSACAEMGIDSTPMEGIVPEEYDKILGLDEYATLVAVAIGYRDEDDFNQPSKKPKSRMSIEKIIETV